VTERSGGYSPGGVAIRPTPGANTRPALKHCRKKKSGSLQGIRLPVTGGGGDWRDRLDIMAYGMTGENPTSSRKRVMCAYKPSVKRCKDAMAGGKHSISVLGDSSVSGVAGRKPGERGHRFKRGCRTSVP